MVYFISNTDGEFSDNSCIKVGYTGNSVKGRIKELQNGNPDELSVLWKIEGDLSVEKNFHKLLSKYHIRGEWFKYNKEVADLIAGYRVGDKKMGVRKLIYVPNEKIWETIKATAKKRGRSASDYLIHLHNKYLYPKPKDMPSGKVKSAQTEEKPVLKKQAKATIPTGWVNPLVNTALAPKK